MTKDEVITAVAAGTDLSNGNFRGIDLEDSWLKRARFAKCDFTDANLATSNLTDADFSGAILRGANLYGTHLQRTNLTGADLTGANVEESNIEHANLTDCKGIFDAGQDPRGYRFIGSQGVDGIWMVKAGCRWFTIAAAKQHWGPNGRNNDDALERVALIEASGRTD